MTMKNKKKQEYMKKIVLTGNFPQNGKQSGLVSFYKEKNVITCTTYIDTRTDIIESVQETLLVNDDDLDIMHNDSDI